MRRGLGRRTDPDPSEVESLESARLGMIALSLEKSSTAPIEQWGSQGAARPAGAVAEAETEQRSPLFVLLLKIEMCWAWESLETFVGSTACSVSACRQTVAQAKGAGNVV
jgi:hypothetical protein